MNGRSWTPQDGECCFSDMARSLVKIMKGTDINTIIYHIYIFISEYIYNKLECGVPCTCKYI